MGCSGLAFPYAYRINELGYLITLHIELNAIRSFLYTASAASDIEYSKIKSRSEAGEFGHYDDEANAYFIPMKWDEIACKSTLGELNALFETKLQEIASAPFQNEYIDLTKQKMVSDLSIGKLIKLIEKFYQIRVVDIVSYNEMMEIRNKVNSFKHRNGFKHPFKDKCTVYPEKVELSRIEAFKSIDIVASFLKDLLSKTQNKQSA